MIKYRDNMTAEEQAQLQAHCDAFDEAWKRATDNSGGESEVDKLYAYGHLNWTVGNEDWIACFDAIRVADGIAYHVVVDCESGGFTDTLESGTVAADVAVEQLGGLPSYWHDICAEYYLDSPEPEMMPKSEETLDCERRWREHLAALARASCGTGGRARAGGRRRGRERRLCRAAQGGSQPPGATMTIDRSEVARCLAKAIAYKQCNKDGEAAHWARKLIEALELARILKPGA